VRVNPYVDYDLALGLVIYFAAQGAMSFNELGCNLPNFHYVIAKAISLYYRK
jgi:hypothetical protein